MRGFTWSRMRLKSSSSGWPVKSSVLTAPRDRPRIQNFTAQKSQKSGLFDGSLKRNYFSLTSENKIPKPKKTSRIAQKA